MACLPEIPSDFADRELGKTGLLPAPTSDAEPQVRADNGGPQVNYFFIEYLTRYDACLPFIDFLFGERLNFLLCGSYVGRVMIGLWGVWLWGLKVPSLSVRYRLFYWGRCSVLERIGCPLGYWVEFY